MDRTIIDRLEEAVRELEEIRDKSDDLIREIESIIDDIKG